MDPLDVLPLAEHGEHGVVGEQRVAAVRQDVLGDHLAGRDVDIARPSMMQAENPDPPVRQPIADHRSAHP